MESPQPLQRCDLWACVLLASVLLVAGGSRMYPQACGQCHDDAIYVATARGLAEGQGYRLVNLPGDPPPPQTKYPILWPAMLAVVWKLWPDFPANLLALKGITLLCGMGALALSYLLAVRFRYAARPAALLGCLLVGTAPSWVFFSVVTLSEMFFAVLMLAAFWYLEGALRSEENHWWREALGGVVLALPFLCRSIGILFLPVSLLLLWQRGKRVRWTIAGVVLATAPWLCWMATASRGQSKDPLQDYYTDYLGWWLAYGVPALPRIVTFNLTWIITGMALGPLEGLARPMMDSHRDSLLAMVFSVLGVGTLAVLVYDVRQGRPLATLLVAYLVLVLVWPWMPHRFLVPVLPLLAIYQMRAGWRLLQLRPRLARFAPFVAGGGAALLLLLNVGFMAQMSYHRHVWQTPFPELGEAKAHKWENHEHLLQWIQTHTQTTDVVASGADPMINLYTGRRAYYPIICSPLAVFYQFEWPRDEIFTVGVRGLEHYRPRYLALTANFHGENEFRTWVQDLQNHYPNQVHLAYALPEDPRYAVYEIHYPLTDPQAQRRSEKHP